MGQTRASWMLCATIQVSRSMQHAERQVLAAGIHRCAQMSWPLDCYVWRYPDLMAGYCAGAYETCDWNVLSQHMKGVGLKEGRVLTCKSNDVRCYLQRYEDLRSFCVNGNISLCHWHDLMAQWHDAGQTE